MLCSITTIEFPASTSRCNTCRSRSTSAKCSPVVGSSRIYIVRPVPCRASSAASLTRCASPPESVVAELLRRKYTPPKTHNPFHFFFIGGTFPDKPIASPPPLTHIPPLFFPLLSISNPPH